ncbi:MAG TPA: YIP1 family protein [Clostridiales bacterium]|nr:YIP1 family protein [Clostridiales bacterium]
MRAFKSKKAMSFLLVIVVVILIVNSIAFAESRDYILDGNERIPIPETYILKHVINRLENAGEEVKYFNDADDLFINKEGYLFVADTGNNRIVKLTADGRLVAVFKGSENKPFNSPMGVYADEFGNMYVADTGNQRVVHLSADGEFVEEFLKPESELLGASYTFSPSKLCISPTGYLYVTKGQNVMTIDAYNRFRGFMGQNEIGFKLLDAILRMFASQEQKRAIAKRTAAAYLNLTMDEKGMLYAVTMDSADGEIKKLNSIGENIYRKYGGIQQDMKLLSLDFITKMKLKSTSFVFGERKDEEGKSIKPFFKDIAVDKNGVVTVIEQQTAKIYQYDQEGNLLTVFGGKKAQKGGFSIPTSLAVDPQGCIYVLDRGLGNIQVFEPTRFIKLVHNAVKLYSDGDYDRSYAAWQEVLKTHENYRLAHEGLAKTLFKQKKWKDAMEEFKEADDRNGYSKAYIEYRYYIFRKYFTLVVLCIAAIVVGLIYFIKGIRKLSESGLEQFRNGGTKLFSICDVLKFSTAIIFHPVETFELIKSNRERISVKPGVIILLLAFVSRILYMFVVHYPLADIDLRDSNIILEAVKLLLPVVTWVVASFAITAITDGESKINEIFIASSFCMIPYILINTPLALLSNILSRGEQTLYGFIQNGTWIWILILFFIQVKILNDYKTPKTTATCVVSALNMGLIWAVCLMIYVLSGRLVEFITGIIQEIKMIVI